MRTPPPDTGHDGGEVRPDVPTPDVPATDTPRDTSYDAPIIVDRDAACATASAPAIVERRPVDIILVIDNSGSMAPAIRQVREGINSFADQLFASDLDYRLILLSARGEPSGGSTGPHRLCVDPPLATADCGDGERFFHIDVNIGSTKPIEQFLGTLAQTDGYQPSDGDGSEPWAHLLRPDATKTIVMVTDDNARTCDRRGPSSRVCDAGDPPLTVTSLEDYAGGGNPFSSLTIGPGILTATYGDLFEGYTFNAIYGWGSETDPDVECTYASSGASVEAAGHTYTALVARTGGVRAQICDEAAAWGPFFTAVANTVLTTSRIECQLAVPPPPDEMMLVPSQVNVLVDGTSGERLIGRVLTEGDCTATGGWYYDDNTTPTEIRLCPASCDFAQAEITEPGTGLNVLFGCDSILM